ncbi:uncharacterized protein LOC117101652 [Anneissia japonica]|uniref:uncharacterized protein LOC117101652 n=1 Tax=Anneissia japonica TaxID=1529436 RepID=UPI001425562B|nr:uncharacterized protein LOC117101652 [Anneissia japonica]XP_033097578.1 uncharacterized protein LOC117101652 [Anneissia japonica]
MAYIYGNAIHVSVAVFVLGIIEVLMWGACFFGCQVWGQHDYGIAVFTGVFAIWTGIFGICMTKKTLDRRLGSCFLCSNIILILVSTACILLSTYAGLQEYEFITERARTSGDTGIDITGLVIFGTTDFFAIILLIAGCYASFMNCCCEPLPPKEFGFECMNYEQQCAGTYEDADFV